MNACPSSAARCGQGRSARLISFPLGRIEAAIYEALRPEDLGRVARMALLILPRIVLHELAFFCRDDRREAAKGLVLAALVPAAARPDTAVERFDAEQFRGFLRPGRGVPTDDDLLDAYFAVRDLICAPDGPSPEAMATWLGGGWDNGVYQRRVEEGDIEGGLSTVDGVMGSLACHLAIRGKREGLMPSD